MKINIGKYEAKETSVVGLSDIPLTYIDTKDTSYQGEFTLAKEFSTDSKSAVRPWDTMPSSTTILFDDNGRPVKNANIRRRGNEYIYEPSNVTEFKPQNFSCTVSIKRHMTFQDNARYNLQVGVMERDSDLKFSTIMINAFGDAYKRGICPANITVNNGETQVQSLIENANDSADFLFVQSNAGAVPSILPIDTIMGNHMNLWISTRTFGDMLVDSKDVKSPGNEGRLCDFYAETSRTKLSSWYFDMTKKLPLMFAEGYEAKLLYEDVLLLHRPKKGYVVVTPYDFLEKNIGSNGKIIYDVMMYIFLMGYQMSRTTSSWITDKPVDYAAYSYSSYNQYHKKINLSSLLANDNFPLGKDYSLVNIILDNADVSFISIDSNEDMHFRKNDRMPDPQKTDGMISYLTTKETIMLYSPESIYRVTSRVQLTSSQVDGGVVVTVGSICDSEHGIFVPSPVELKIPDISMKWLLCTKPGNAFSTNTLTLVEQSEYSLDKHGFKIAAIRVIPQYSTKLIDVRMPGGGLPSKEKDIYSMVDIGNVYGRPYRIGSTLIIRLPKRLKEHEDIILEAVNEHIVSGDYPVLIFE